MFFISVFMSIWCRNQRKEGTFIIFLLLTSYYKVVAGKNENWRLTVVGSQPYAHKFSSNDINGEVTLYFSL